MRRVRIVTILAGLVCAFAFACGGEAWAQTLDKAPKKPPRNLAILIFENVQIIDYTGPYETFGHTYSADQEEAFNIYTVSEKTDAITTWMGMSVNPKYSFDNAPKPDVIVVPGGSIRAALDSPKVIEWLQKSAKDAEIVMSVCNGAFILAKAGLLDGLEATTTAMLIERLKTAAPKTKVVADKRYVDNGKIITTAGLSSGIDGSLHVIERLYGRGTAEMAALGMEYNWDPESKFVRAALADRYMPSQYDIEPVVTSWVPASRTGDLNHWQSSWTATSDAGAAAILQHMEASFTKTEFFPRVKDFKWVRQGGESSEVKAESTWRFADEFGNSWRGEARVDAVTGRTNTYLVSVTVKRINAGSEARP